MILERILDLARPALSARTIREVRIGLNLLGVALDDGSLGVTYVLREEIGRGCTVLPRSGTLAGMPAGVVAGWAVEGTRPKGASTNVLAAALGLAVLNSVAPFDEQERVDGPGADAAFSVEVGPADTVGMVGSMGPVVANLGNKAGRLFIFERGKRASNFFYPEEAEPELLPQCDVVFASGTSLINGTLEGVLASCTKARDIVLTGTSTPMYPQAFRGTGVTVLAGTRWLPAEGEALLAGISEYAGVRELIRYGRKISARVERGIPPVRDG